MISILNSQFLIFNSHCKRIIIACAFAMICAPAWADRLQESFDARADSFAAVLIAERAGPDSAAIYRALPREEKAQFLIAFWQRHNSVVMEFYYGYHIGRRYLTVSDAFFERGRLIPQRYKTRARTTRFCPCSTTLLHYLNECYRTMPTTESPCARWDIAY